MVKTNDAEIDFLFSNAEHARTCLIAPSPRIRESLRRQVEQGRVLRPLRGMYVRAPYWRALSKPQQALHMMRTLQRLHPDWTFCHESAAVAFGLSVSFTGMDTIHVVTSRANRNAASEGIQWHVVENDASVVRRGIRVTSLPRTVFDCMRTTSFGPALALADSVLRFSGSPSSSFVTSFKRIRKGHAGASRAIRTMYYADPRSESGGESIARAAMIENGFALPQLQVAFPQPCDERRTFRVDFLWTRLDGSQVIGEFDGMQKYEDEALRNGRDPLRVLADEQHRESLLTLYGMPIVRFSYSTVMDRSAFVSILKHYGIPQSDEVARTERRLARSRSTAAQLFMVERLD